MEVAVKIYVLSGYRPRRLGDGEQPGLIDKAALSAQMYAVLAKLRFSIQALRAEASDTANLATLIVLGPIAGAFFTSPEEAQRGVQSALATLDSVATRLQNTRDDVLSGAESIDKWLAGADALADGIQSIAQDLRDSSTANLVAAQWTDFKSRLPDLSNLGSAGPGVPWYIENPWLIPVVGVGAVAAGWFALEFLRGLAQGAGRRAAR